MIYDNCFDILKIGVEVIIIKYFINSEFFGLFGYLCLKSMSFEKKKWSFGEELLDLFFVLGMFYVLIIIFKIGI